MDKRYLPVITTIFLLIWIASFKFAADAAFRMLLLYEIAFHSLTARGKSLIPILDAMCDWGYQNRV